MNDHLARLEGVIAGLENAIGGLFIALLTAMDRDASDRAIETLFTLAADRRTGGYEAKLYTDLATSIAEQRPSPAWSLFEQLTATVH